MVKYELVFIVDARLSDAEKGDIAKQMTDLVTKCGGKVVNVGVWIEKQRFTFPMKKIWEGTYYLANIEMVGPEVARLRRELQLNERLLRFLIVNAVVAKKT
ncbi:MAG: 30S ribosomal protein S6 [Candidatus Omnitrophica bacterium]|nr:30S ribosomal protein S6 [Candidatus Omnitrophota bacterium]